LELAALAGLSIDYYIRLEQGKETNPSTAIPNPVPLASPITFEAWKVFRDPLDQRLAPCPDFLSVTVSSLKTTKFCRMSRNRRWPKTPLMATSSAGR
jgi:hypothetical protein